MFLTDITNIGEPLLEPVVRLIRFNKAKEYLKEVLNLKSRILDFGCGPGQKLKYYMDANKIRYSTYTGFDPLLKSKQNLKFDKYDVITLMAVLEHMDFPEPDFSIIANNSKKGTVLIITTPTKKSQKVLEFLSHSLGVISRREINEHKHYYDKPEIESLFSKYDYNLSEYHKFFFGFNSLAILIKQ